MPVIAIVAALLAALSWAVASIAIGRLLGRGQVSAAGVTLFKNGVAATAFFVAALVYGGRWPVGQAWGWLFLSGILGFAISDALYFAAFRRCGVQAAATVMLLNVPIATLLAVPLAGDALDVEALPYMGLVLVGVLLVVLDPRGKPPRDSASNGDRPRFAAGVLFALAAAIAIGTAVPLGRGRFDEVGVCPGGFVRLVGGAIGAFPLAMLIGLRRGSTPGREMTSILQPVFTAPGPGSVWSRLALFGVGVAVVGLAPYHYALRELPGGLSALLFSSTPLFTLVLALLFGERIGGLSIVGAIVGFAGVGGILMRGEPLIPTKSPTPIVTPLELASAPGTRVPTFVATDGASGVASATTPTNPILAIETGEDPARVVLIPTGDEAPRDATAAEAETELYVNWADVPKAARLASGGGLVVAYLERIGAPTYAYGVRLAFEEDGPPARRLGWLHRDSKPVEHGFVSVVPEPDGGATLAWLDGRADGRTQLFTRRFLADGSLGDEVKLDKRVCDCCPTSSVLLDDGALLVVYRDRTDDERRDISCVRREPDGREWGKPVSVSDDGWMIAGCPVNGPAVAASGGVVAVAWFTQGTRRGLPEVRVAFSTDGGRTFSDAVAVARGDTLGRVAVAPIGASVDGRRDAKFTLVHLAARSTDDTVSANATWEAMVVAPGARRSDPAVLATVESTRKSGRLDLVPVGDGSVEAVWSEGAGLSAARLSLPGDPDETE